MRKGAIFYGVLFLSFLEGQDTCRGFHVPLKKFRFSQKFYQERLTNALRRIDTDAVYLLDCDEETPEYRFMRFFSDRVVYVSCTFHSKPDSADYNNLCAGRLIDSGVISLYGMYYVTGDTLIIEFVVPYRCYEWRYTYDYISPSGDSLFFLGGGFGRYPSKKEVAYNSRYAYVRKQVPLWNYDWRRHTKAKYLRLPWREREARRIARAQRRQARRSK
jgi:hypothetical protein